jgi:hypothetical protein
VTESVRDGEAAGDAAAVGGDAGCDVEVARAPRAARHASRSAANSSRRRTTKRQIGEARSGTGSRASSFACATPGAVVMRRRGDLFMGFGYRETTVGETSTILLTLPTTWIGRHVRRT